MGLSNFPTSLDSWTDKTDNTDDVLAAHVNKLQDAVEALEAKLGIDSSAVVTSLEYILKNASSQNPGHKHTLATGATDVTATKDEINSVVDGCTATAAEINTVCDGTNLLTFTLPADTTISAFAKTVLDDADASAVRTTIGCPSDPAAGTAGLRTLGTGATQACAGNDSRLNDERTPTDASVSQAKLKTSLGSNAVYNPQGAVWLLPGGEYGFGIRMKKNSIKSGIAQGIWDAIYYTSTTVATSTSCASYTAQVTWTQSLNDGRQDGTIAQRYVTSSGEVHWIFILRNRKTKKIKNIWQAPDHPCFGNGGKPLLVPHPFGNYDETKHEIIVINPTNEEIEQMELETIVDDETKPDKDLLEIIQENYEIDEDSNPAWPTKPVTVGLPKHIKDKNGKKILADYRFMKEGTKVEPIKKVIPKPSYIKCKSLKRTIHKQRLEE